MKKTVMSGLLAALAAGAVQAGTSCDFLLERISLQGQDGAQLQVQDRDGVCVMRRGQWNVEHASVVLAFDELSFSGAGLDQDAEEGALPRSLKLDVSGIYTLTGRLPGQDYLMRLQASPMRFGLDYEWDEQAGRLHLKRAVLSGESLREISLQAAAHAPALAGRALHGDDLQALKLQSLALRLDNVRLVQNMIMPAVVGFVGMYEDPRPAIQAALLAARTAVMVMPPATAPAASRKALLEFIGELPAPTGRLDLNLSFDPPLDSAALAGAQSMDEARKALSSMKVQARYDRGELPAAYVRVRDWIRRVLAVSERPGNREEPVS